MTIRAQIEGGPTLEFPDDTPSEVIQQKVREYTDQNMRSYGAGLAHEAVSGIPVISPLVQKAQAATEATFHRLRPSPAISHATGSGSMLDDWLQRYHEDLEREQAKDAAFEAQYPKSSAIAQAAGGVAATAPLAATALGARILGLGGRTLAGQMGRSAASGSAISGLDTALRGGSLEDVAKSAGLGGAVGAVTPPVVRGAQIAGAPIAQAARTILNPEEEAVRRASVIATRGQQLADPTRTLTPGEMTGAQTAGYPVSNMTLMGAPGEELLRSAANTSPEARQILERHIDDAFRSQSQRTSDMLNSTLNYPTEQLRNQAISDVRQNVYEPMYARAYADSATVPLWPDKDLMRGRSPAEQAALHNLEELAQAPDVQTAIRAATPMLRNWAVRDGLRPPVGAFTFDNSGGVPRTVLRSTPSGNAILPSLQLWDYVKRALDGMDTSTSRQFSRALRDNLDTLVPTYRDARAAAQPTRFFEGASNAYEAGQNYVNKGVNFGDDAVRQLARMTPTERALFQDGYTQSLINQIEKRPDRLTVINQINQSMAARQELERALGPARVNEIEAHVRIESIMDNYRRALGNSTTARQWHNLAMAGGLGVGADTLLSGGMPTTPDAVLSAVLMMGAAHGRVVVNQRVAQNVARLLVSPNQGQLRLGTATLAQNPALMDALRNGSNLIARIVTPETQQPR